MSEKTFTLFKDVPSIYLGTFNMNGATLTLEDAKLWLLRENKRSCTNDKVVSIHDADLVILSLQECPTYPDMNNGTSIGGSGLCHPNPIVSVLGPPKIDENKERDELKSTIQSVLSNDHILMADIAMGEPPTSSNTNSSNQSKNTCSIKTEKWFGFIRLMIYAKSALANHILSSTQNHNDKCIIPILSPAGRKRKSTYPSTCIDTTKRKIYTEPHNMSPDKGGVCVAIPSLKLLICSVHLCGTNKYHTLESEFDSIRIKELIKIGKSCRDVLEYNIHGHHDYEYEDKEKMIQSPSDDAKEGHKKNAAQTVSYEDYKKIILGDLNFRVEICSNENEKGRGGLDFQLVMDAIMSSNHNHSEKRQKQKEEQQHQRLDELFWNHDRLVQLLQQTSSNKGSSSNNNSRMNDCNTKGSSAVKIVDKKDEGSCDEVVKNDYHNHVEIDILKNVVDLFMEYFASPTKNGTTNKVGTVSDEEEGIAGHPTNNGDDDCQHLMMNIPPTFTFIVPDQQQQQQNLHQTNNHSSNMSRVYSDKRTPSWTDRILIDKRILNTKKNIVGKEKEKIKEGCYNIHSVETHPDVSISDHIALSCMLIRNNN